MNKIVSTFLLAGHKFMAELLLRYNVLRNHILKTKKRLEKVLETRGSRYIYQKK